MLDVKWKDIKDSLTDEWDENEKEVEKNEADSFDVKTLMLQGRTNWHKSLKDNHPKNKSDYHESERILKRYYNKNNEN